MRALGIDFGTSNTVAVVRGGDGRTRPLLFDGTPLLPSAVYREPDGRLAVGHDAHRRARVDPAGFEPHPKRRVDDGTVLLRDAEVPVPQLIAAVLRHVAVEARRQLGGVDEVRLSHPASWGQRRRAVLVQAAYAAGLPQPTLVAEPVAAAAYYTAVLGAALPPGRALAVYDLGGGTFDAAVVRRDPTGSEAAGRDPARPRATGSDAAGFVVLAEQGLTEVGGLEFDQALVEHLGRAYSPNRTVMWNGLVAPADTGSRRARALLYDDVRAAKETLSRTASADVHLPALDVAAHLTRDELESLIHGHLSRTVDCLARTVAAAGLTPADLVGVFLVGGSSRIPLAARLIHTQLGVAPTTLEQPETVVADGVLRTGGAARTAPTGPPAPPPAPRSPAVAPVPYQSPLPASYPVPAASAAPARPWYDEYGPVLVTVLAALVGVAGVVLVALLLV
ncbi:Hsp70 family protein [Solwaraspora sp. WMMA2056]|uniref:Hsp70 family protein n=1 Tax=Solwaraspora sp. WMMA2056 TaxID=3015161 RepID=UPI00259B1F11|nr:Hsp70 family protein [Solwaraspora sp. WMMA2056]WJK38921.1 Hsp70 family protein [Solwaraspora sp. WMMA2056]